MRSLTSGQLMQMALEGRRPTKDQVLEMYADRRNWTKIFAIGRSHWVWIGPVIVGYEAASTALRNAKKGRVK